MAAGKPVRLIVPKARQEGVSTFAVSHLLQRATLTPNQNCISIAQNTRTAGQMINMANTIYAYLPASEEWPVKPPIKNSARLKEIVFGNPSKVSQTTGDFGVNSSFTSDTASEAASGRGFTYHAVHCSEVAFWDNIGAKLTSVFNAVPNKPNTFIILESTSNGFNEWRDLCNQAQRGENDFEIVFLPWFEEPENVKPFLSLGEREEFIATIGTGPWGEEEPELVDAFALTPEQLNWRRWAIANSSQGDLDRFHVEYPATLEQSFLASGSHVFSAPLVARMIRQVDQVQGSDLGTFEPAGFKEYRAMHGVVQVPLAPKWVSGSGPWRVWKDPEPDGQYVIGADPAGDDSFDKNERAMHAAVVIDHKTREQVAEIEFQGDTDEFAVQIYLAALHYNRATIAVETTGSWGAPILRRIRRDWKYAFVYKRKRLVDGAETAVEELGWDTNRTTKGFLIEAGREMLREGTHGIRSMNLALQFTTYVRDGKSKYGPSAGQRADLLMAYLIAHMVANESPLRSGSGNGSVSTTTHEMRYSKTGY